MRAETGQALLDTSPQLLTGGPGLSSLVGRVVAARTPGPPGGIGRVLPAAPAADRPGLSRPVGLVSPPPPGRSAPLTTAPAGGGARPGGVALLGAHGGAGVGSLLRAGLSELAADAGRVWPVGGRVLVVARTSVGGLEWARDLARQHASGTGGGAELVGLVLLADAPGRLPGRARGLLELTCGAFPRVWRLPWIETWRLAATGEPLPGHPALLGLLHELRHLPA